MKKIIIKIEIIEIKEVVFNVLKFFKWLGNDIKNKKWKILLAIGLSIGAYFLWGLSSALLWLLFLVFLFCTWDSRVIAFLALICLASCPVLLQMKKDDTAETMAVYAYFFLAMTVFLQIFEYRRDSKLNPEPLDDSDSSIAPESSAESSADSNSSD
ncbi:MAG: hypothetical protein WC427_02340 [Candidatus Paceibacterota bacterium]